LIIFILILKKKEFYSEYDRLENKPNIVLTNNKRGIINRKENECNTQIIIYIYIYIYIYIFNIETVN